MSDADATLEGVIAQVYRGPLDDFVRRRDAAAKELRSAGQRDAARVVKSLRKPTRPAWALDQAALESRDAVGALVQAVGETIEAQRAGGDVRAAIVGLRAAVRSFAIRATRAAERAGLEVETGALVNAVFAVLGKSDSFDQLRSGRLADVPEGGGLDLLAAVSPSTGVAELPDPGAASSRTAPATEPQTDRAAFEAEAREEAESALVALGSARDRSLAAREALRVAESDLAAAEVRLREAEAEVRSLGSQRASARAEADVAAALLAEAESAAAQAERRLGAAVLRRSGRT